MKATPHIRIEVGLPPAVVLEQLARYGKDWHESRLPPEVRGRSVLLSVQGSSVKLQLPTMYGQSVVWRGSVIEAEAGGGSLITLAAERGRGWLITNLLGIPLAAVYGAWRYGGTSLLVVLPLALALLVAVPLGWARRVKYEAQLCRAILLRATQATPASSTD